MVGAVEAVDGDLLPDAEGEAETAGFAGDGIVRQWDAADDDAGSSVGGVLSVIGSALEVAGVEFELRPEETSEACAGNAVLEGCVPGDGVAETLGVANGERAAGGGGDGEVAPAFAQAECRGDDGAAASVAVFAGGNGGGEVSSHNLVAVLLVAGEDAVLGVERHVSESVFALGSGVVDEGRHVDEDLDAAEGDELETLAVAEIPGGVKVGADLADDVSAKLLLETGCDEDERGYPMRLLVLRGGDAGLVTGDEAREAGAGGAGGRRTG